MKKALLLFSAIMLCGVISAKKQVIATGEYSDWCDFLDYINITKVVNIDDYQTVIILPVGQDKVDWPDEDDNKYPALKNALAAFPSIIKDEVSGKLKGKNITVKVADSEVEPQAGEIVIKVNIEELNMGSRALRFWVGFGAGNQNIEISGYAKDASGNCFTFKQKHYSVKMSNYEKVLKSEFEHFGGEIGDIFVKMQK